MNTLAEFEAWALRVEYLAAMTEIYERNGEPSDAAIYKKSIVGAIAMREKMRNSINGAK